MASGAKRLVAMMVKKEGMRKKLIKVENTKYHNTNFYFHLTYVVVLVLKAFKTLMNMNLKKKKLYEV